jgi:3',5'-cyclic AMP phosphodiesterase CpdA
MFRLAHVTDPHFRTPRGFPGVSAAELLGKRAVGYLNMTVNRVRKHKMDLLEDMRVDLRAQAPDHLALTGDLSNIALGSEWRSALAWLDLSGVAPDAISVIPGNHDAYVPEVLATREFERLFAPYQTSDLDRDGESAYYPFVQIREPLALIGVSSAVATGDLGAWGRIGEAQLARLEAILTAPEVRALTRVVLIHHPPVVHKGGEHRNLRDRAGLAAVLARAGAELVLHGHDHHDERAELPGPDGRKIPIIGAGSASYAGGPERRARYSIYEFEEGGPPGGPITWVSRVHDEATSFFREARREALVP